MKLYGSQAEISCSSDKSSAQAAKLINKLSAVGSSWSALSEALYQNSKALTKNQVIVPAEERRIFDADINVEDLSITSHVVEKKCTKGKSLKPMPQKLPLNSKLMSDSDMKLLLLEKIRGEMSSQLLNKK